jgi:hypothetical protein
MKRIKQALLQLEGAWKTLDGYAMHSAGCPMVWGQVGACDCGLTAARVRVREAVLELLTRYAMHDAECPGVRGKKCDCGLDSARRRLQALARTPLPDVTGGSPPTKA